MGLFFQAEVAELISEAPQPETDSLFERGKPCKAGEKRKKFTRIKSPSPQTELECAFEKGNTFREA